MSLNGPTPLDMPRGSGEDDTLLLYGTIGRGGRKTCSAVFHAVRLLNSRPLTPLSSEVEDLEILTPGHFLIGRPITAIPEPLMIELNDNRLNRWQLLTKKVQAIWKHWSKNYLNNLQQRHKWMFKKDNVKIGDMVLIKEDNVPVSNWP
ncbi:hypothetical protein AVEN_259524-1 [Araneus ventricosus]|uniref:DUF5641 domain-containing protein n=1 Tax=Araneus ventricosus TaxID=182803 RepID=A0A4Y2VUC5_ARAVE|nr:hypothetical protein AVEN_259524-1 [Araneus ventricosus]